MSKFISKLIYQILLPALMALLLVGCIMGSAVRSFGQNSGALPPWSYPTFLNANGTAPLPLGFVCTYAAGTTTPLSTYQDNALMTANQNPIRLSAAGQPVNSGSAVSIYLTAASYKFSLYAAGTGNTCNGTTVGALIKTVDNIYDFGQLLANGLIVIVNSNINNIRYCNAFSGATAGAKIAACIADLPSTGGTADARGLEGAQTLSQNVFAGITKPVTLLLGAATFSVTATQQITSANNMSIIGTAGAGDTLAATKLTWTGSAGGTVLFLDSVRDSTFIGFNIVPSTSIAIGIRIDQVSAGLSTNNKFYRIGIGASTTGIQIGNSSTSNNDLHTFEDVVISGAGTYGYFINHGQSKWNRIDRGSVSERTSGGIYLAAGSFVSHGINFSNNTVDVQLGAITDSILIEGCQSESSDKLLDDGGATGAPWAVTIIGCRADTNSVGADNIYVRYRAHGPLTMIGNEFANGVYRAAIRWSISTPNTAGFISISNVYPNGTPFASGTNAYFSLNDAYIDSGSAGQLMTNTVGANLTIAGLTTTTIAGTASVTGLLNVDTSTGSLSGQLASGRTVSTASNSSNIASVDASFAVNWSRTGGTVTFSGKIQMTPAGAGLTSVQLSLPVSSAFASEADAGGSGLSQDGVVPLGIVAESTNDLIKLYFLAPDATARTFDYSGAYTIR